MRKIILYIATSLDGYIAKTDGSLDWLTQFPNPTQLDYGYAKLLENTDSIIMGGTTYRDILNMEIEWPYKAMLTYVITRNTMIYNDNVVFLSNNIEKEIERLKNQNGKNIWLVGGGEIIRMMLNVDLIDEMQISYIPILLGEGIPLFPPSFKESGWHLTGNTVYESGIINLDFQRL